MRKIYRSKIFIQDEKRMLMVIERDPIIDRYYRDIIIKGFEGSNEICNGERLLYRLCEMFIGRIKKL